MADTGSTTTPTETKVQPICSFWGRLLALGVDVGLLFAVGSLLGVLFADRLAQHREPSCRWRGVGGYFTEYGAKRLEQVWIIFEARRQIARSLCRPALPTFPVPTAFAQSAQRIPAPCARSASP